MPVEAPRGIFPWNSPYNIPEWLRQQKQTDPAVPGSNVVSTPAPLIAPQGNETAPRPVPVANTLPKGQGPGGSDVWNAINENNLRDYGSQVQGMPNAQPQLGSPSQGGPASGGLQGGPGGGRGTFAAGATPSPTVGGQVRSSAPGPGGGLPTNAQVARSPSRVAPSFGSPPAAPQPGLPQFSDTEKATMDEQWRRYYETRNTDYLNQRNQDFYNQQLSQWQTQHPGAPTTMQPQYQQPQQQNAQVPYLSNYRVTSGAVQPAGEGWYSVDTSNLRAWTGQMGTAQGALDFVWNGLPAVTKPLESGDMREQIALRLGPNQMNEISMAWRMNSGGGIVVQMKYNPGISDPAPGQSNVTGYSTIQPSYYKAPAQLAQGQQHQIQYVTSGNQLEIYADGTLSWKGTLPAEAMAIMRGELNVRADNWRGNFALATGAAQQSSQQPTQQTQPQGGVQLSQEWQQFLSRIPQDQYTGDRQIAAMMYETSGPQSLDAYGKWLLGQPGGVAPQGATQQQASGGAGGSAITNWGGWAWGNVPISAVGSAGFSAFEVGWSDSVSAADVAYLKSQGVTPYAYINLGEQDPNLPTGYTGQILRYNGDWGTSLVDVTNQSWQDFITRRVGEAYSKGITGIKFDVAEPDVPPGMTRQQVTESLANLLRNLKSRYSGLQIVLNQGFSLAMAHPELVDAIQTEGMFSGSNMQPWNTSGFWWKEQYDDMKYLQSLGIPVIIAEYTDPNSSYGQQLFQAIQAQGFIPYITSENWQTRGATIGVNAGW